MPAARRRQWPGDLVSHLRFARSGCSAGVDVVAASRARSPHRLASPCSGDRGHDRLSTGWGRRAMPLDALVRISSNTKPMIAAVTLLRLVSGNDGRCQTWDVPGSWLETTVAFVASIPVAASGTLRTGRHGLRGAWRRPQLSCACRPVRVTRVKGNENMLVLGIDAHKRTHTVVAVDEAGRSPRGRRSIRALR